MQLRSKASQSRLRRICLENKLHRKASFSSSYVSSCIYFDNTDISGGDALMGHTRSHPEHDG